MVTLENKFKLDVNTLNKATTLEFECNYREHRLQIGQSINVVKVEPYMVRDSEIVLHVGQPADVEHIACDLSLWGISLKRATLSYGR